MYSKDAHLARIARTVACASVSVAMAVSVFTALPLFARAEEEVAEPEATVEELAVVEDEAEEEVVVEDEAALEDEAEVEAAPEAEEEIVELTVEAEEETVALEAANEELVLTAAAPSNVGWVEVDGHWTYYNDKGDQVFGFYQVKNKWYYFDPDNFGYMEVASVFEVAGAKYVADDDGVCNTNKWVKVDGKWYFTGLKHGEVCTGWIKVDGKNYYMGNDGVMRTGWFSVSGKNYIADDNGVCQASKWVKYDGQWYLTDANCACRTGWAQDDGTWYYLREDGSMATGWVNDGKNIYYMNDSGAMCTGWKKLESDWYFFKASGAMATGWAQDKDIWYYLDPNDGIMGSGKMVSNQVFSDGKNEYVAKASGECPADGWVKIDGSWYRTNSSCAIRTGWYKVDDVWYFSSPMNGKMIESTLFSYNGKAYIATASGACPANTWVKLSGYWYVTDENCACRGGWVKYKDDWYYMDKESYYMLTDTTTPDGYKVDKDGKWVKE